MRELSVHKRRIYRRLSPYTNSPVDCLCMAKGRASGPARPARRVPVGFTAICHLPPVICHRQQHPSALTMRFLSVASHLLHSGFLQTNPRAAALAVGSWLSLLTMSPSRYSHRGLAPRKFAPMLGAHPPLNLKLCGGPGLGSISFQPKIGPPQSSG